MNTLEMTEAEIATKFESLGGGSSRMDGWGFGCEFGTYQRFNGLEPLGLLRWASINPRDLIRALNDSFEKVDLMSTLQVYCASGNDWQFVQKAYDMRVDHTYLPTAKFTADQAAVKICRSLAFLRRKILEDLALGDKIFVYRVYDYILPDEEISEIGQSIARLGSATFLCVQKCLERAFTVERFSHNSYVGFIDRFAPLEPVGIAHNREGWARVLQKALEVCRVTHRR